MLSRLAISNYAIIEQLEVTFTDGLTIITGETGAGKSILMGALSLVLGDRAEVSALRDKSAKCVIEATFLLADKSIEQFLQLNELDSNEELVLRREVNSNGKSRAFINDTPVNLSQLKQAAALIVDLHQQFDNLDMGEEVFQRTVLDAFANNKEPLASYTGTFRQWQQTTKELNLLIDKKQAFVKEFDYNQFLFDELNQLQLQPSELEHLEQELKLLTNAETIKSSLDAATYQLSESDNPVVQVIKQLYQQLHAFADINPDINAVAERLLSTQIELKDIAAEIATINNTLQLDAARIQTINDRLSAGYKLLKKHGVSTTNELLEISNQLEEKLQQVLQIDDLIVSTQKQLEQLHQQCLQQATIISKRRNDAKPVLEKEVNRLLKKVGMPNALLNIKIIETELNPYGNNIINFLFDANNSNRFEPISKVASGGELSRLMLCVKSLIAGKIDLPTMIFDEIDTGISGEAAKQVGLLLKDLAANRQVICITHQPQIAGKANHHLFVYKTITSNLAQTKIRKLSQEERITIIAQMIGGEKPTAAALENARELVMN